VAAEVAKLPPPVPRSENVELFLLTGGPGAAIAFLAGLAFARSAFSLLILAAAGALVVTAYHAGASPNELLHATANANLLGWLLGTDLAARVRALEWVEGLELDPEEAA
jgi:hypothetical protein